MGNLDEKLNIVDRVGEDTKAFLCQDLRRLSSTEIKGFEGPLKSRFES